jgi:lysophospholipase L1-like esterase
MGNLGLLTLALGISVIAGEMVMRTFVALPLRRVDPEIRYLPHDVRRFTLRPGQAGFTYGAPATIDECGFRIHARPADRVAVPTIFALGDSFTFGLGVGDEDTWPARLQTHLNADGPHQWRVVNGGTISYGVFQEMDLLKSSGLSSRPTIVIHALYWNDYMNAEAAPAGAESVVTPDGYLRWDRPVDERTLARKAASFVSSRSALLFTARQAISGLSAAGGTTTYAREFRQMLERGLTDSQWRPVEAFYRDLQSLGAKEGFAVVAILMPVMDIVAGSGSQHPYASQARGRLERLGVPFIDAFAILAQEQSPGRLFLPQGPDAHLNAEGYRLIAAATASRLDQGGHLQGARDARSHRRE